MRSRNAICAIFIGSIVMGCSQDNEQLEQLDVLQAEISQLNTTYQEQLIETRNAVTRADSLQTLVHDMQREMGELKGNAPVYKASEADEEAIETLVHNLHQGWSSMFKTRDTNDVLQYFLPEYTATAVRIDSDNVPRVRRKNDHNFEQWLNELIAANDVSLSFGETRFLYTEVRGDVFVTSYRTTLRVYEGNQQKFTNSLVVQLAGERNDGWKAGHYNWVSFNY